MKFSLLIIIVLISCAKQKEESCVEVEMVTYVNGREVKRVTAPWYANQDLSQRDTIVCEGGVVGEVIVTSFHKCRIYK